MCYVLVAPHKEETQLVVYQTHLPDRRTWWQWLTGESNVFVLPCWNPERKPVVLVNLKDTTNFFADLDACFVNTTNHDKQCIKDTGYTIEVKMSFSELPRLDLSYAKSISSRDGGIFSFVVVKYKQAITVPVAYIHAMKDNFLRLPTWKFGGRIVDWDHTIYALNCKLAEEHPFEDKKYIFWSDTLKAMLHPRFTNAVFGDLFRYKIQEPYENIDLVASKA